MPNGYYPIPNSTRIRRDAPSQSQESRTSLLLRLRVWWRQDRLDVQLAEGTDPHASAELELRAHQLGSGVERTRLADEIDAVLGAARRPAKTSQGLLRSKRVQANTGELLELARRLRGDEPINPHGAAITSVLLWDLRGPIYYEPGATHLRQAVQRARLALDEIGVPAAASSSAPWPCRVKGPAGLPEGPAVRASDS